MNKKAEIYVPFTAKSGKEKIMCVGAHPDDVEFMALEGIIKSYYGDAEFYAVVVTDGAGSARNGRFSKISNAELVKIRAQEQKQAAILGRYFKLFMLNYTSEQVREKSSLSSDLAEIINEVKPRVIYAHSVLDRHPTHLAVARDTVTAVRNAAQEIVAAFENAAQDYIVTAGRSIAQDDNVPAGRSSAQDTALPIENIDKIALPLKLIGCEAWRDLDWLCDADKISMDVSCAELLSKAFYGAFPSQIEGGKRYDLAIDGRQRANATYGNSHSIDSFSHVINGIDMTPLIVDKNLSIKDFALSFINRFKAEQAAKWDSLL